ncbi:rhamnulokinase [Siculibacillus lacustris]|uniref:Rhamnulokinase n=1 Tax=Siculibacillus lacustris TaxID=1549641 RepID=A0A4Q9VWG3_9HYPH|nr:rhamnulokinase [Siculibacillus lacustris]TBW40659.1 rhamnulokinase [Siculibacillus lacustris]
MSRELPITRVAAVDLGAGSGRVILAELADGHLALTEAHRFETPGLIDPETGEQCWDVATIEAEVRRGIAAAEALAPLDSVGCDTWGVDFVLLDGEGRRIGPAVAYRDKRTDGMMDAVFARIAPDEIWRRTGIHFQPYNTLYQLAAVAAQHPDRLARARHLLMMPDWLHYCLSGAITNEFTIATTSQMLNLETGDWDPALLALVGAAPGLMKTPVAAGTVIGEHVLPSGRRIKVVAPGGHDTASAVAAAPLGGPDEAFLSSGTWSLMGIESPAPFTGPDARRFNFGNEGGVCGRRRVLKNLMGLWLIQGVRKEMGGPAFADLVAAARAAPAWTSVIDPDDPRLLNPRSMVATLRQLCAEAGEPLPDGLGPLARCVFDSLALDYARVKDELEVLRGAPLTRIRIIGGGSQNTLLNQLCADACRLPVSAGPVETSALGNACLQMMALGAIGSLEEARAVVRGSFAVTDHRPGDLVPDAVHARFRAAVARSAARPRA